MGIWGVGLYQNDIALDVKSAYKSLLKKGLTDKEAEEKLLDIYCGITADRDESPFFWMALADTQWNLGRLDENVKRKAFEAIATENSEDIFGVMGKAAVLRRKAVLKELENKLTRDQPKRKTVSAKKAYICDWKNGDIYYLPITSELAKEFDLAGEFLLFHKVGDTMWHDLDHPNHVNAVVRVKITNNGALPLSLEEFNRLEYVKISERFYLPEKYKEEYRKLKTREERINLYQSKKRKKPVYLTYLSTESKRQIPKELKFFVNYPLVLLPENEFLTDDPQITIMSRLERNTLEYYLHFNKGIPWDKLK